MEKNYNISKLANEKGNDKNLFFFKSMQRWVLFILKNDDQ